MPIFGLSKTIEVAVTDAGVLSWVGYGDPPNNIVAKEDRVVLSIDWPDNSESFGKTIEAWVMATDTKHSASISGNTFTFPDTWLQEGQVRFQLIMDNGVDEWKTNILTLPVGMSIDYLSTPAPDPESSWVDLMTTHEGAVNPHPQYHQGRVYFINSYVSAGYSIPTTVDVVINNIADLNSNQVITLPAATTDNVGRLIHVVNKTGNGAALLYAAAGESIVSGSNTLDDNGTDCNAVPAGGWASVIAIAAGNWAIISEG